MIGRIEIKCDQTFKDTIIKIANREGMNLSDFIKERVTESIVREKRGSNTDRQFLTELQRHKTQSLILKEMKIHLSQAFSIHRTIQIFYKVFDSHKQVPQYLKDKIFDTQIRYIEETYNPKQHYQKFLPFVKNKLKYRRGVRILEEKLKLFSPPHRVGEEKKVGGTE